MSAVAENTGNQILLPNNWTPRPYQLPAMWALEGGIKRAVLVWHRRAGKDSFSLNYTAKALQQRVGTFIHFLPLATQARRVVWNGVDKQGRRMIDQAFPKELRANTRDQDMMIEFKNGSFWYCAGSDNYEALMGTNPVGVVFSEYAIGDPQAWELIRPILAENGGWALFIYTPRGKNHGHKLYEMAKVNPDWFCERLPLDVTKAYPPSIVDEEIAAGMDPELAEQEFACSFQAPNTGSLFGREMEAAELQGRISAVPYETQLLVHTAWDLGTSDDMAIVLFQQLGREIRVLDFIHGHGHGFAHYVGLLKKRRELHRFTWGDFCMPHDIMVTEMGSGTTRLRALKDLMVNEGVNNWKVGKAMKYPDTLVPIRSVIPRCYFDPLRASHLISALQHYHRKYDEKKHAYQDAPEKNWSSHPVDAFREMANYCTGPRRSKNKEQNAIDRHRRQMERAHR
jgi:hypothetical protein